MAPYEKLEAWQYCHRLALRTRQITRAWPPDEKYGLTAQIRRATFSAGANIAEGGSKRGRAEFARYLDIALGSLAEVEYCIRFAKDMGYLGGMEFRELQQLRDSAGKLTWRLYEAISPRLNRERKLSR